MHHVFSNSDSYMYWCLAYICEGIFELRIYVVVTSPYPQDRGVINIMNKTGTIITTLHRVNGDTIPLSHIVNQHANIQFKFF